MLVELWNKSKKPDLIGKSLQLPGLITVFQNVGIDPTPQFLIIVLCFGSEIWKPDLITSSNLRNQKRRSRDTYQEYKRPPYFPAAQLLP